MLTAEQRYLLWLSTAEVTPGSLQKLLERYGTIGDVWESFGTETGAKIRGKAGELLLQLHSEGALDDLCEKLKKKNVKLLYETDEAYPQQLREIQDPPYLLYYAGKLNCLQMPMIGVVGTRRASTYGSGMAAMITRGLCDAGVCVVSGLARGIDAAAHQAALQAGGSTIGILGSGINVPYPGEHTEMLRRIAGGKGLIISEYPLDSGPLAFHFPHRNRIISGLSIGVVFVEGRIQSGGMHTVHAALAQGREVFAVPGHVGSYGSEGPHAILREGARIITSAKDLLEDCGLQAVAPESTQMVRLTPVQKSIVALLHIEPLIPQEIAIKLNMSAGDVINELGTLEILGVVNRGAGNRFELPLLATK